MIRIMRMLLMAAGTFGFVLAVGFFLQQSWATALWPWPTSRLSNIFIASMLAASALPTLWIGVSGEMAAMVGGAIDLCVAYAGMAAFSFIVYAGEPGRSTILLFGLACAAFALVSFGLAVWGRHMQFHDARSAPRAVRLSFVLFFIVLIYAGATLVLRAGHIFPWRVSAEQSVLYGLMFLGSASYFLYGVFKPAWANARGQLLAFLAYDLVLIVPFAKHFAAVDPSLWLNLVLYTAVLVYSGLLAAYYLFFARATRFGILR